MYPFSSNASLRDQYERFQTSRIRAGLILEDLDAFAADIAARHAGSAGKTIVTASVDQISWLDQNTTGVLSVHQDLKFAGQVGSRGWPGAHGSLPGHLSDAVTGNATQPDCSQERSMPVHGA